MRSHCIRLLVTVSAVVAVASALPLAAFAGPGGSQNADLVFAIGNGQFIARTATQANTRALHPFQAPDLFVVGNVAGAATDDVVASFSTQRGIVTGVFQKVDLGGWQRLTVLPAQAMAKGDFNGNGTDDVAYGLANGGGTWVAFDGSITPTFLSGCTADVISAGDIDGNGNDDVLLSASDNAGCSITQVYYDANPLTRRVLRNDTATVIEAGANLDEDTNDRDDAIFVFSSVAGTFYLPNESQYVLLRGLSAERVAVGQVDGSSTAPEVVAVFSSGTPGTYFRRLGTNWSLVGGAQFSTLAVGQIDFDANGDEDVLHVRSGSTGTFSRLNLNTTRVENGGDSHALGIGDLGL